MEEGSHTDEKSVSSLAGEEMTLEALLASLKKEVTPEANFEERFLYDFRERVTREAVCCPARHRLWEHAMQMLANFGHRRLACGASTLGIGALAVGYVALPGEEPIADASARHGRFERAVAALSPALARDCRSCTSCIHEEKDAFAVADATADVAAASLSYRREIDEYTSAAPVQDSTWSVQPARSAESFFRMPASAY